MSELKDLQKTLLEFSKERDWEQFHNPKDLSISLILEATEVLEHFQWKDEKEVLEHCESHKENISDELADTFYWLLMLSNKLDIDLADALKKKMIKNAAKYPVEKSHGNHKKYTELS